MDILTLIHTIGQCRFDRIAGNEDTPNLDRLDYLCSQVGRDILVQV